MLGGFLGIAKNEGSHCPQFAILQTRFNYAKPICGKSITMKKFQGGHPKETILDFRCLVLRLSQFLNE